MRAVIRPSTISRSVRSPAQPPMQSSAAHVDGDRGARRARRRRCASPRGGSGAASTAAATQVAVGPVADRGRGRSAARRPPRARCRRRSRWGTGGSRGRGTTTRRPRRPSGATGSTSASVALDAVRGGDRRAAERRGGDAVLGGRRRRGVSRGGGWRSDTSIAGQLPAVVVGGVGVVEGGQGAGGPAAVAGVGRSAEASRHDEFAHRLTVPRRACGRGSCRMGHNDQRE